MLCNIWFESRFLNVKTVCLTCSYQPCYHISMWSCLEILHAMSGISIATILLSQWYTAQVRKASLSPQCYPICPWDMPVECTLSILEGNDPSQVAQLIRQPIKTQTGHVQSQQHLNIRYERPSKRRDNKGWLLFWNRISASVAEVKGDHQSLLRGKSYFPQKSDDSTTGRTAVM